jgi:sugar phosphate isomerase/epimerase
MKLCVSSYSLTRWRRDNNKSLEDTLAWIAEQPGIKAVEFAGLDDQAKADPVGRARALKKRADELGLAVPSYCVGAELLVPADKQREVVKQLKQEVDVAAALGVRSMRHDVTRGFGDHTKSLGIPETFDAAVAHVAPAIREVSDYAKSKGIITSLENHGFYMQAAERVQKLIETVAHPNFRLTIDMGNFLCVNDDPVRAVERLAKYVVMAHVKDFHVKPKDRSPGTGWFNTPTDIALRGAICGHGAIDIPAQLRLLVKAGYDGYLSLEFEGMEEPASAVRHGLEYVKKQLDTIGAAA